MSATNNKVLTKSGSYFTFGVNRIFHNPQGLFHIAWQNLIICATMLTEVIPLKENKLIVLSMDFSVKVIKLYKNIKGHYSLVNQLER